MPSYRIVRDDNVFIPTARTARIAYMGGLPPLDALNTPRQRVWEGNIPIEDRDWQIGFITGQSGSGKSTIARECWPRQYRHESEWAQREYDDWPGHQVTDGFRATLSAQEVTDSLVSVGFSSTPDWLRPYNELSDGEKVRAHLARALVDPSPLIVFDEFCAAVQPRLAQVVSAGLARGSQQARQAIYRRDGS